MKWGAGFITLFRANQVGLLRLLIILSALLMVSFLLLFQPPVGRLALAADVQQGQGRLLKQPPTGNDGLTIQIRSDVTTAVVGSTLRYTMTVANQTMMTTTDVIAFTFIPTNTSYLSGTVTTQIISALITQTLQPGGYYDPQFNAIAWVGALAPNTTASVHFTVRVQEASDCRKAIQSTAAAQPTLLSPFITDTVTINLLCTGPVVELIHTSNVTAATFHESIVYQVSIRNSGLATATNLNLTVNIPHPVETTYITGTLTASGGNASYDAETHTIRWRGVVPAQGQVVITYTIELTEFITCATLYSHAKLEAPSLPTPLAAVAKVEYRCPRIKALEFAISASVTQTTPGNTIDYRLTLTNPSDVPTDKLQLVNALPFGAGYVPGSATATQATITYDPLFKELLWSSVIPERSAVELSFQAQIIDRVQCGLIINNQATVYNTGMMEPSRPTISAQTVVTCTESQPWSDFGDAPDSESNHHGMNNTAYADTGVFGRFPTVWAGTPATEGSGPTHLAGPFWLGDEVDIEAEADVSLDANAINHGFDHTNLLFNGKEDVADQDLEDDGWLNPYVPMLNCTPSTIVVRIHRSNLPTTLTQLWLNVWFDGNRDGDWQDSGDCPGLIESVPVKSFEWLVQDWAIDASEIPASSHVALKIPTKLIYNTTPTAPAWLRFTLSERPALRPTVGALADGRGPAHPALFRVGETEDYLIDGLPSGEPISVKTTHEIENASLESAVVAIGDEIYVSIALSAAVGIFPATVVMSHSIPAEVTLTEQPVFEANFFDSFPYAREDDGVTPLEVTFQPDKGASGQIEWRGQLVRNARVLIYYATKVKTCPPPNGAGQPILRSVVQVRQPDGTLVNTETTYPVDCTPTGFVPTRLFLPLVKR